MSTPISGATFSAAARDHAMPLRDYHLFSRDAPPASCKIYLRDATFRKIYADGHRYPICRLVRFVPPLVVLCTLHRYCSKPAEEIERKDNCPEDTQTLTNDAERPQSIPSCPEDPCCATRPYYHPCSADASAVAGLQRRLPTPR